MIHINRGDGNHELLTDAEFQARYPDAYTNLKRPAPFEQLGKIMSRYRKDADISLRELAKKMDMRLSELCDLELGRFEITDKFHERYLTAVGELRAEKGIRESQSWPSITPGILSEP